MNILSISEWLHKVIDEDPDPRARDAVIIIAFILAAILVPFVVVGVRLI